MVIARRLVIFVGVFMIRCGRRGMITRIPLVCFVFIMVRANLVTIGGTRGCRSLPRIMVNRFLLSVTRVFVR